MSIDAAVRTFAQTHSDSLLQHAVQSISAGWRKAFGDNERPVGMTEAEFEDARARHEAGERTIGEVEAEHAATDEATDQRQPAAGVDQVPHVPGFGYRETPIDLAVYGLADPTIAEIT
jgi:hypothetical protein